VHDDLDGHDGLDDDGFRLEVRGDAERGFGRIDCVERVIAKDHAHSGDRVSCQRALLNRFKEALLDRGDVVARYVPAHHDALERCVRGLFAVSPHWLNVSDHTHVLPWATCLLLVRARKLRSLRNHFACGPPRRDGDAVLALHPLDVNLKVELSHSRYDRLTQVRKCHHALQMRDTYLLAFAVDVNPERQVFLLRPVERTRKVGNFIADRLDG
jgi:hypothetical protein